MFYKFKITISTMEDKIKRMREEETYNAKHVQFVIKYMYTTFNFLQ